MKAVLAGNICAPREFALAFVRRLRRMSHHVGPSGVDNGAAQYVYKRIPELAHRPRPVPQPQDELPGTLDELLHSDKQRVGTVLVEVKKKVINVSGENKQLRSLAGNLESELKEESQSATSHRARVRTLETELSRLHGEVGRLYNDLALERTAHEVAKDELRQTKAEVERRTLASENQAALQRETGTRLVEATAREQAAVEATRRLEARVAHLEEEHDATAKALEREVATCQQLTADKRALEDRLADLDKLMDDVQVAITDAREEEERKDALVAKLQGECDTLRLDLQAARDAGNQLSADRLTLEQRTLVLEAERDEARAALNATHDDIIQDPMTAVQDRERSEHQLRETLRITERQLRDTNLLYAREKARADDVERDRDSRYVDMQTSRAELQTVRDELRTTRDELQTTRGELQTTLDELHAADNEIQAAHNTVDALLLELRSPGQRIATPEEHRLSRKTIYKVRADDAQVTIKRVEEAILSSGSTEEMVTALMQVTSDLRTWIVENSQDNGTPSHASGYGTR